MQTFLALPEVLFLDAWTHIQLFFMESPAPDFHWIVEHSQPHSFEDHPCIILINLCPEEETDEWELCPIGESPTNVIMESPTVKRGLPRSSAFQFSVSSMINKSLCCTLRWKQKLATRFLEDNSIV